MLIPSVRAVFNTVGSTVRDLVPPIAHGMLGARLFTTTPPLTAATFLSTYILGMRTTNALLPEYEGVHPQSMKGYIRNAIPLLAGYAVAQLATTALGLPVTFSAGAGILACAVLTNYIVQLILIDLTQRTKVAIARF